MNWTFSILMPEEATGTKMERQRQEPKNSDPSLAQRE